MIAIKIWNLPKESADKIILVHDAVVAAVGKIKDQDHKDKISSEIFFLTSRMHYVTAAIVIEVDELYTEGDVSISKLRHDLAKELNAAVHSFYPQLIVDCVVRPFQEYGFCTTRQYKREPLRINWNPSDEENES